MKKTILNHLRGLILLVLIAAAPVLLAAENQAVATPVARMPETVYEFPDTLDGDYVVHDFVVQNKGDAVLNVLKVEIT